MRSNETKTRGKGNGNGRPHRVHFEFFSLAAEEVSIVGAFNDWRPNATPMIALGQGRWAKDLVLLPGSCEYCLRVDGEWLPDPKAAESVPNLFGGRNSILRVGNAQ